MLVLAAFAVLISMSLGIVIAVVVSTFLLVFFLPSNSSPFCKKK